VISFSHHLDKQVAEEITAFYEHGHRRYAIAAFADASQPANIWERLFRTSAAAEGDKAAAVLATNVDPTFKDHRRLEVLPWGASVRVGFWKVS